MLIRAIKHVWQTEWLLWCRWPELLSRLRRAEGWAGPMLLVASLGAIGMTRALGGQLGLGWIGDLAFAGMSPLWCLVGGLSVLDANRSGLRALRRFGLTGPGSPRWWFEMARLAWFTVLYAWGTGMLLFLYYFDQPQPPAWLETIFPIGAAALGVAYLLFLATASLGYVLSFVSRRPRRGRAYTCVRFFYTTVGGFSLLLFAVVPWAVGGLMHVLVAIAAACGGISISLVGLLTLVKDERRKQRRATV